MWQFWHGVAAGGECEWQGEVTLGWWQPQAIQAEAVGRAAPSSQAPLTLSGCFINGDRAFQIQMIELSSKWLAARTVAWTLDEK